MRTKADRLSKFSEIEKNQLYDLPIDPEPPPEVTPESKPKRKAIGRAVNFVNAIVLLCLFMCIIITLVVLWDYHRLDMVMGTGEIAALLGMWGGELLLIVVRQVLGSDIGKKRKSDEEDEQ